MDIISALEKVTRSIKEWVNNSKPSVYVQPNAPVNAKIGDVWYDTDEEEMTDEDYRHKLIFSGAVDAEYDGTEVVNINIPSDFVVTFNIDANTGAKTVDKTSKEVYDAWESGRAISGKITGRDNKDLMLSFANESSMWFVGLDGNQRIDAVVYGDGSVSISKVPYVTSVNGFTPDSSGNLTLEVIGCGSGIELDKTLSVEGKAADAKAVGDALAEFESRVPTVSSPVATIGYATLLGNMWVDQGNYYSQVVNIEGVTEDSQVDLTPGVEQLAIFYEKDLSFVTENEDGVVTVYAIGQKPQNDYTIQVTITEVNV